MARPLADLDSQGPFRADQIRPGDPYELSNGHPIYCSPSGGRGSQATGLGYEVLGSDPAVQEVGVDTGFTPSPGTLRAPDVAVGNVPAEPGWVQGCPQLAVEYADTGQDEEKLAAKIYDLLEAGTELVWVVRLTGPRRVEVHAPGQKMRVVWPGDQLEAPGILQNPVPVEALYDPQAGRQVVFRNLLQRQGYDSLEEVRAEGRTEGKTEGAAEALRQSILDLLVERGLAIEDDVRAKILGCSGAEVLRGWLRRAVTAASAAEAVEPGS